MARELSWLQEAEGPVVLLRSSLVYGLEDGDPVVDLHKITFVNRDGTIAGIIEDVDGIAPTPQADGCGY